MKKKNFVNPIIEIIVVSNDEIICTSGVITETFGYNIPDSDTFFE